MNSIFKNQNLVQKMNHKIIQDFEIQMDHQILARNPDFVLINEKKNNLLLVNFSVSVDHCENKS